MASEHYADLVLAAMDEANKLEEQQAKIVRQNQKASLLSGIGEAIGAVIGTFTGSPILGAVTARALGETGEHIAGGFRGGDLKKGRFWQKDTERQNKLFDAAKSDMNLGQWMNAVNVGIGQGTSNIAQGSSFFSPDTKSLFDQLFDSPVASSSSISSGSSPYSGAFYNSSFGGVGL